MTLRYSRLVRRHEYRKVAAGLRDKSAVADDVSVQIGNPLTAVDQPTIALDQAATNRSEIVDLDLDGGAELTPVQCRVKRSAHAGIGQCKQNGTVHDPLRIIVALRVHYQLRPAAPLFAQLDGQADEIGERVSGR